MYWSPNFGRSFQKARNFTASTMLLMSTEATRMQDLATEFSKKKIPGPPQREGATPSRTDPQPGLCPDAGPVLGPKPWSPQIYSRCCAPGY